MSDSFDLSWSPFVRLVHDFHIPPGVHLLSEAQLGDHALHFFLSGSGWYASCGVKTDIHAGMLFIQRPGEDYDIHLDSPEEVRMLNIRFDLEDVPEFRDPHPCPAHKQQNKLRLPSGIFPGHISFKNPDTYTNIFFRLLTSWHREHVSGTLAAKGALLDILALASGHNDQNPHAGNRFSAGKLYDLLQKHSRRSGLPPTPEMLAAEAGMSRSTFYRYFSQHTGKSIHRYFLEQRILSARMDLLHTADGIKTIAERHGFSSVHHFTKVFTRETGTSPGEFRRQHSTR